MGLLVERLWDEFCNDDIDHFSNYDYLLQVCDNGQWGPMKEFIKGIQSKDLLTMIKNNQEELGRFGIEYIATEIESRIK